MTRLAELDFNHHGDVQVARLRGEVDLSNAVDLSDALAAGVPAGARGLVIDMTGLTHIDSSGVRLLFGLRGRLAAQRQRLAIVVPPDAPTREVLDLAAVGEAIPIYSSVEGAVLALLGTSPER